MVSEKLSEIYHSLLTAYHYLRWLQPHSFFFSPDSPSLARSPWFIIPQFIGFIVFLIAAFAETNRVPFDLPEAETELVAGFHTEYSALKFALFFMAEYVNMFTVSVMCVTLFLGGWYVPGLTHLFPYGSIPYAAISVLAFFVKISFFLFFYIWVRGTLPRFRFDQLMNFGWKFLLPVAIANVIFTIVAIWFWHFMGWNLT